MDAIRASIVVVVSGGEWKWGTSGSSGGWSSMTETVDLGDLNLNSATKTRHQHIFELAIIGLILYQKIFF